MFVPGDFQVPVHLSNDQFKFEVLEPSLSDLDYAAVMSSKQRLRHVFSENDEWPDDAMTYEFNKNDLLVHENEFKAKEAFAYAVFDPLKTNYIGCVYINPTESSSYDCEVYLWVKDSELKSDKPLFDVVENWLREKWPFKRIAYPGRTIAWCNWP